MRKPFKMRSGNSPMFKHMGGSPMKAVPALFAGFKLAKLLLTPKSAGAPNLPQEKITHDLEGNPIDPKGKK